MPQAAHRGAGLGLVRAPQQPERAAQLPHGLVTGQPDHPQRGAGRLGVVGQCLVRDRGLHPDHRDGVAQHVVQVPGDAQPLLLDPPARLPLPLGRGLPRGAPLLVAQQPGGPHGRAQRDRGQHQADGGGQLEAEQVGRVVALGQPERRAHQEQRGRGAGGGDQLAGLGRRVQRGSASPIAG